MGLPRTLKNMMLFLNGVAYAGEVKSVTLPKLGRKLEEYRGAGMDSAVKLDMGGEAMDLEFVAGGPMRDVFAGFAGPLGGEMVRFAGAYQQDDTGGIDAIEVYARGRYEEIDQGEQKPGDAADFKAKLSLSYYRLEWNGEVLIEAEPTTSTLIVGGVDRLAGMRAALGI